MAHFSEELSESICSPTADVCSRHAGCAYTRVSPAPGPGPGPAAAPGPAPAAAPALGAAPAAAPTLGPSMAPSAACTAGGTDVADTGGCTARTGPDTAGGAIVCTAGGIDVADTGGGTARAAVDTAGGSRSARSARPHACAIWAAVRP